MVGRGVFGERSNAVVVLGGRVVSDGLKLLPCGSEVQVSE
jgi:hypothetical protein